MTNLRLKAEPTTYAEAAKFLGDKASKSLGYQTKILRRPDWEGKGIIAVQHFNTDIVTYHEDGLVHLNNGGYNSRTTAHRMHLLTPSNVRVNISGGLMQVHLDEVLVAPHFPLGGISIRPAGYPTLKVA